MPAFHARPTLNISFRGHESDVMLVCVSPNGSKVVSGSEDKTSIVYQGRVLVAGDRTLECRRMSLLRLISELAG